MDDLTRQLQRLADHHDAQLEDDEGQSVPAAVGASGSPRRGWLAAAALIAVVGVGAIWFLAAQDSGRVETAAVDAATTTARADGPTVASEALRFESRLGYAVELPASWTRDTTPEAGDWSDSMTGGDGEFLRSRPFDVPDRSPFVDSVPEEVPNLEQTAHMMAALFPADFGANPVIGTVTIDGRVGWIIRPSADAATPDTVTYLFEAPASTSSRFLEIAIDRSHAQEIMATLVWLPDPNSVTTPPTTVAPEEVGLPSDAVGRLVLEDMFDAMAASEWEIAAGYFESGGSDWPFGPEVAARIGEYDPALDPSTRLADYCETALCNASFAIGGSDATSGDGQRTFAVTFESVDGPVVDQMQVGYFEGTIYVNSVPPPGIADDPGAPIDVRVFGETYTGDLTVLRYGATESLRGGNHTWAFHPHWLHPWWLVPHTVGVAGGSVVADWGDGVATVPADGQLVVLADEPAQLGGASTLAGGPLVFIVDGRTVSAVDPDGTNDTVLFNPTGDESIYAVDASDDRIVTLTGAGESTALEVYNFDPATRAIGELITRLETDGYVGPGHLAPDGHTIAATLEPTFYDPTRTVALFDVADGSVLERWTVDNLDTIEAIDYDGRFIVADLTGGGIVVIDTDNGTTRQVNTGVTLRFE